MFLDVLDAVSVRTNALPTAILRTLGFPEGTQEVHRDEIDREGSNWEARVGYKVWGRMVHLGVETLRVMDEAQLRALHDRFSADRNFLYELMRELRGNVTHPNESLAEEWCVNGDLVAATQYLEKHATTADLGILWSLRTKTVSGM